MIIYLSLTIPAIIAIVLYVFFKHRTAWWEFAVPFIVTFLFILITKSIIEYTQVQSTEYWGSFVKEAQYYEDWNEYIHQTCECCCDEDGNCSTYDCSYVDYHPEEYWIKTTTNESVAITKSEYQHIKKRFNNSYFRDLHRDYHTNDGDMYASIWPKDSASSISVTTIHTYENRVKAADQSVFHFEEVRQEDKVKYDLKEYPEHTNSYTLPCVIGDKSTDAQLAELNFQYINGLLGKIKEVRLFVLVFKNQPVESAIYQEWYWAGGNKNEFIICIGIDSLRNVKWCKPISWTKSEQLKAQVKDFVQSQDTLNLQEIAGFVFPNITTQFSRRHFKEFDYLTVNPPLWCVITSFILALAINISLSVWIINNEVD